MQRDIKKKLAVCLVIVLICSGIYYHRQLGLFMKSPVLIYQKQTEGISTANNNNGMNQQENTANQSEPSSTDSQSGQKTGSMKKNTEQSADQNLETNLEQKAGQPIAKLDILKASLILLRKLTPQDLQFLRQAARKDTYTQEDYERSREIIQKLSPEDISMLKQIGKKYGNDLSFLNQIQSS